MLQVRVVFDLVHDGDVFRGAQRGFQVRAQVVGHADRLRFAGFFDGFHSGPGVLQLGVGFGEVWRVDQVQVDVGEAEFLQTGVERGGDVGDVGQDFRRDEEFGAGNPAGFDGGAELGLGAVGFGAVEVHVTHGDGGLGRGDEGLV